jgi:nitrile hydratase subunit beta
MTRFQKGDEVRIRHQKTLSHSRIPEYAAGRIGVIERVLSDFVIPEDDAWGRLWKGGRHEVLYRVQLHQEDTWPGYQGSGDDTHELEIFEHWLEPVQEA